MTYTTIRTFAMTWIALATLLLLSGSLPEWPTPTP